MKQYKSFTQSQVIYKTVERSNSIATKPTTKFQHGDWKEDCENKVYINNVFNSDTKTCKDNQSHQNTKLFCGVHITNYLTTCEPCINAQNKITQTLHGLSELGQIYF